MAAHRQPFRQRARLRDVVWKKSSTAASSQSGAFDTSTTTCAPSSAWSRPSPVYVSTPVSGDAASASCPAWRNLVDELRPDQAAPADDNDLHLVSFRLTAGAAVLGASIAGSSRAAFVDKPIEAG